MIRILAIPGSLRATSLNKILLQAAATLAPDGVNFEVYDGLGTLPPFNPDLTDHEPPPVLAFQRALRRADALFIASPEYAHGVSGVMKNALDWVVADGLLVDKPVAVLNVSGRAILAYQALIETLQTMNWHFVAAASLTIPLIEGQSNLQSILNNLEQSNLLRQAMSALVLAKSAR